MRLEPVNSVNFIKFIAIISAYNLALDVYETVAYFYAFCLNKN